jgi:hypothetical protein
LLTIIMVIILTNYIIDIHVEEDDLTPKGPNVHTIDKLDLGSVT